MQPTAAVSESTTQSDSNRLADNRTESDNRTLEFVRPIVQEELSGHPRRTYSTAIWKLADPNYRLKVAFIPISVEEWGEDDFVAQWREVEATGFGEDERQAIADLQECIVDLYEELMADPDEILGIVPLQAKQILKTAIEKTNSESQ